MLPVTALSIPSVVWRTIILFYQNDSQIPVGRHVKTSQVKGIRVYVHFQACAHVIGFQRDISELNARIQCNIENSYVMANWWWVFN